MRSPSSEPRMPERCPTYQSLLDLAEAIEKGSFHNEPHVIRRGDVDAALAEAAHVVSETFRTKPIEHAFLEPEAALGRAGRQLRGHIGRAVGLDHDGRRPKPLAIQGQRQTGRLHRRTVGRCLDRADHVRQQLEARRRHAGDEVGLQLRGDAVGHVLHTNLALDVDHLAGHMQRRADAGRGVAVLAGIGA